MLDIGFPEFLLISFVLLIVVGPPIDIAVYKKDQKKLSYLKCLNTSDEDYKKICNQWSDKVLQVFDTFPKFDWEK